MNTQISPGNAKKRLNRKRFIFFAALVAGISGAIYWLISGEPMHQGKPVSYWVDRACAGLDNNESYKRRDEVKSIGPAAVPLLVDRLRVTDIWRGPWNSFRKHLPDSWQRRFPEKTSAHDIHYGAARTLALFGPEAAPATRELANLLPESPYQMIAALTAIGPNARVALPALHAMLTNSNTNVRVEIAGALWAIGRETNMVLQICTNALMTVDSMNGAGILANLREGAAPAVPFALIVLRDTNHSTGTRANSAIILGAARIDTPEIRAALTAATEERQDGDHRLISCNSALALWRLDPQYAPLGTRLAIEDIVATKKRFPGDKEKFMDWLVFRDIDPRQSIPALKQLQASGPADLREEAARALTEIQTETAPKK